MLGFYNYTVILTYLGLVSSVMGIFLTFNGQTEISVLCLMFSGFCDMFDGRVARTMERTKQQKEFGIQIDSLADLVCFGVLPAVIGYSIGLRKWYQVLIPIVFVLAALIRLAYFNVMEEERQKTSNGARKVYEGLPVTSIALIVPFIYILKNPVYKIGIEFHVFYGAVLFLVAVLYISKIKIKKTGIKAMLVFLAIGVAELAWLKMAGV